MWFLSAISFWFLALLSSPWFQPPKDALANSVAAIAILVTLDLTPVLDFKIELEIMRWVFFIFCMCISILSLLALFLHDSTPQAAWTRLTFRLTNIFGRGEILYTMPALLSIVGAYQHSIISISWLVITWVMFIVAKPVELSFITRKQWRKDCNIVDSDYSGQLIRLDDPNIVRIRLNKYGSWVPNTLYVLATPDDKQKHVIALFSQMQDSEIIGTGLCAGNVVENDRHLRVGQIKKHPDQKQAEIILESISGAKDAQIVGFTVENSTIGLLKFEMTPSAEIKEGDVVFSRIDNQDVFYQILDAETTEESFDRNPRGAYIVKASQLGIYGCSTGFTKYQWLPAMNSPLFSAKSRHFERQIVSDREFVIAKIPTTEIEMVANIDEIVEYHTAILGATGTGKTELALEIIRVAIQKDIKVFCVDFTGDYKYRLADVSPIFPALSPAEAQELEIKLFEVETGKFGAPDEKKALKNSIEKLRASIEKQVEDFLNNGTQKIAILELAEIANTKASLRLTEMYLSTIMHWARKNRHKHKIMLALEEAHTIVPETAGAGFDYDTQWVVSRIGQIALQGRKYGVGLLVISQRTALVSKTILSQCNTFLTHSLIDQTSLNFLENVYSAQHSKTIPNLAKFQFLAQGKALRTERPIFLCKDFDPRKKDASKRTLSASITAPAARKPEEKTPESGPKIWS